MPPAPPTCLVCRATLTFHQAQTNGICDGRQCRLTWNLLPADKRCAICGQLRSPTNCPPKVCIRPECHVHWQQRQKEEKQRRKRAALVADAERLRDAGGGPEAGRIPLFVIPAFTNGLANLPTRRRRAFRDHLLRIIGAATSRKTPDKIWDPPPEDPPAVTALLSQACALCKGFCCSRAGDHAYLSADTIRRYLREHPTARPRDVLEAYLSYLANRTNKDSCVYHGPQGCALPRTMRSDACNRYYCPDLENARKALVRDNEPSGFFAAATADAIQATAVLDSPRTVGGQ